MTLIVGVKCSDGIVLGADSSATFGVPLAGQFTIRQDTATKLHLASNRIILGLSGPVGLSQSYSDEVDGCLTRHGNKVHWKYVQDAKTELSTLFWKHAGPAWEKARVVGGVVGQPATMECNHSTAVAFAIGQNAHLVQFTPQCNAEEVTQDLPFVALGSG
jgi:predicted proteasome-type protease